MSTYSGTITRFTRGDTTFHTFTAPEAGFRVNTHIVETATELTVIDAQLMLPLAEEVATLLREIGKPVARFIISHNHPDHYSGLQVLSAAFPEAEIHALQSVRDYMAEWAQPTLDARRAAFGDVIAARAVQPTHTLQVDETTFSDLRLSVQEVLDTEADASAVITFPDHRVVAPTDMAAAPGHHLFLVHGDKHNAENWIAFLEALGARTDVDMVLTGHGENTDPTAAARSGIEWLRFAAKAHSDAGTAAEYAERVKAQHPDHRDPIWADFGSQMLYGLINP
jgi:glyoxylase-like metal-dependent hydrolase (beta-lactamase superfamily II)